MLRFANLKGRISVYNIADRCCMPNQNPRNFAAEGYFNNLEKLDILEVMKKNQPFLPDINLEEVVKDEQFIEDYFSRVESDIKNELDKLDSDSNYINDESFKIKFSIFLYDLSLRTQFTRNYFDNLKKQVVDSLSNISDNYKELAKPYLEMNVKKELAGSILSIPELLENGAELILNSTWHIAESIDDYRFITSDNPAIGVFAGHNEICFPISKEKAIIIKNKDENAKKFTKSEVINGIQKLTYPEVLLFNSLQMISTKRYCFGNKEDLGNTAKVVNAAKDKTLMPNASK